MKRKFTLEMFYILYVISTWGVTCAAIDFTLFSFNFFATAIVIGLLSRLAAHITVSIIDALGEEDNKIDVVEVRVIGDSNTVNTSKPKLETKWVEEWLYYGGGEGKLTGRWKQIKKVDGKWVDTGNRSSTNPEK